MEALKKTSVAAMIMVICIVMAVLLGEMRSGTYKQVEETGVVTQQKDNPISELMYGWSTYGTIQKQIEKGTNLVFDVDEDKPETRKLHVGKVILILIIIGIVSGAFKKKR